MSLPKCDQCKVPGKSVWPELMGQNVDKAVSIIHKENPNLHTVVLNISKPIPEPVDCTRVLVFINDNKQVALPPSVC
ncbi:inhibitor of trypsin and hageman factor-like [Lycium ferocissimum]|uniref:inhibitor of trypsin and hageman factor-like n=1 Tax=Lycium ferocissimum TaxID=112874 RepID=UPI0028149D62|nr:inhibitor of trypsin and hageman factor-like [Lycium ferocissimum]